MRKVCNHPSLLREELSSWEIPSELTQEGALEDQCGKLAVVSHLLHSLYSSTDREKIVLVSISTQVLDLLQALCSHYGYAYLRLDGSTSSSQRQSIVARFNASYGTDFVLLLSSKAGGTGLNLIGASRILLYDMDWNPAHDMQAMARVWRDGQTRPVKVYRLATTGTIEEKIFQRQVTKQGLGSDVAYPDELPLTSESTKFHFSREDLKDLFTFREDTDCDTHSLLNCSCDGTGSNIFSDEQASVDLVVDNKENSPNETVRPCQLGEGPPVAKAQLTEGARSGILNLRKWLHIQPPAACLDDRCLQELVETTGIVSYVFKNIHKKRQ